MTKMTKMKGKIGIRHLGLLLLLSGLSFSLYYCKKAGSQSEQEESAVSVSSSSEIEEGETEKESELKLKLEEKIKTEQEDALAQYLNLGLIQCDSYINFRSEANENDIRNIIGLLRNGAGVEVLESNVE